jgi:hypothetical protein
MQAWVIHLLYVGLGFALGVITTLALAAIAVSERDRGGR